MRFLLPRMMHHLFLLRQREKGKSLLLKELRLRLRLLRRRNRLLREPRPHLLNEFH